MGMRWADLVHAGNETGLICLLAPINYFYLEQDIADNR